MCGSTPTNTVNLMLQREPLCESQSCLPLRCPPTLLPHSNADAKLANPLRGIPRDQLMSDVEVFAKERGLTHILSDLQKGALVAQDPQGAFHESALEH